MASETVAYAFQMAAFKVERARAHAEVTKAVVDWIVDPNNFVASVGRDPITEIYGLHVGPAGGGFPRELPLTMGDTIHNLRAALDYAWSGLVKEYAPERAPYAHFPRHEERSRLEDLLSKEPVVTERSDIGDVLLDAIRPYKEGNKYLWGIGKLDNIDKHRLLLTCMGIARFGRFVATAEDGAVIDLSHSVVRTDGSTFKLGFATPFRLNDDCEIVTDVLFNEPDIIEPGSSVVSTLQELIDVTHNALEALKAVA
jgi:hypothetical protein